MYKVKTAFITGVSGQDGAYLAALLLKKNYKVIGLVRSNINTNLKGLDYLSIRNELDIVECDLLDLSQIIKLLNLYKPNEVYNLAAQSSVSLSFEQPIGTFHFNTISVFNLLEAIKLVDINIKFYQASSSEMYGKVSTLPITETTVFHPLSPYAISKAAAHWACINYRESYKMHVCCGILFNHESYLRHGNFFVKKVITECINIKEGRAEKLFVGNIDIRRDFGYAPDYVLAMQLMMQHDQPGDYAICSGKSISLREIIEYVFRKFNIDNDACVVSDDLYRPTEIEDIYGDPNKAKNELGWSYEKTFYDVLDMLISEEMTAARS